MTACWALLDRGTVWVQCVLVARMVLEDEFIVAHITAGRWEHRRLWLGLPRDKRKHRRGHKGEESAAATRDVEMGKV